MTTDSPSSSPLSSPSTFSSSSPESIAPPQEQSNHHHPLLLSRRGWLRLGSQLNNRSSAPSSPASEGSGENHRRNRSSVSSGDIQERLLSPGVRADGDDEVNDDDDGTAIPGPPPLVNHPEQQPPPSPPPPPPSPPQSRQRRQENDEQTERQARRQLEMSGLATPGIVDPSVRWRRLPAQMTTPRSGCAAAAANMNNRAVVVVVGGRDDHECLSTAECYDVEDGMWTLLPPMPVARQWCAAAAVDGKVYVVGGYYDTGVRSNEVDCFDFDTWTWSHLPRMHSRRGACAAAAVGRDGIVVVGGDGGGGSAHPLATAEYFNFATATWQPLPSNMATPRSLCAAVAVTTSDHHHHDNSAHDPPRPKLIVLGGHDGTTRLSSVECYDFATCRWSILPSMSTSRRACAAAITERGILVAGGFSKDGLVLNTTEHYDLAFKTWTVLPNMLSQRYDCAAVSTVSANERTVIVLGGHDDSNRLDTAERLVLRTSLPPLPSIPSVILHQPENTRPTRVSRLQALEEWTQRTQELIHDVGRSRDDARALCAEDRDAALRDLDDRKRRILQEYDTKTKLIDEHVDNWLATVQTRLQDNKHQMDQLRQSILSSETDHDQPSHDTHHQSDDTSDTNTQNSPQTSLEPPDQLICRLTQELLVNPVLATDGHTYEREAIVRWFSRFPAGQNPRSPATNEVLAARTLLPNYAIKSQCDEFRQAHPQRFQPRFEC